MKRLAALLVLALLPAVAWAPPVERNVVPMRPGATPMNEKGRLIGLVVGISDFDHVENVKEPITGKLVPNVEDGDLRFAEADARWFADTLQARSAGTVVVRPFEADEGARKRVRKEIQRAGGEGAGLVWTLLGSSATDKAIEAALDAVLEEKLQRSDTVILYFATHGVRWETIDEVFLMAWNSRLDGEVPGNAIPMRLI